VMAYGGNNGNGVVFILLSAYDCTPERIVWLVDESVMRSELSERLIPAIERATGRSQSEIRRRWFHVHLLLARNNMRKTVFSRPGYLQYS
jgi:hypothetical protein